MLLIVNFFDKTDGFFVLFSFALAIAGGVLVVVVILTVIAHATIAQLNFLDNLHFVIQFPQLLE